MKHFSAIILSLGLLAGCASTIEGQQQTITLMTPGAENAECHFRSKDMLFVLRTGESRVINKSDRKLTADCRAPGNRQRTVTISPGLEPMVIGNVATGVVPGVAYDHVAQGMYAYPEVITIDFTNIPVTAYPLPDYMKPEYRNAYHGEHERYGSDRIMLPSERYDVQGVVQKRADDGVTGNPFAASAATATGGAPVAPRPVPITEK